MKLKRDGAGTTALIIVAAIACSSSRGGEADPGDPMSNEDSTDGDPTDGDPMDGDPMDGDPMDGDPMDGDPMDGGSGSEADGELIGCERVSSSEPCTDDPNPCGIDSGFDGDEYCLPPPPEGQGIQLHFGPEDYDDPAEIAKYTIEPGEEFNAYGIAHVPLTEDKWYRRVQIQMRPGSHHLINSVVEGKPEEGYVPEGSDCPGERLSGFPGTQNLVYDRPPGGVPAPENAGLGRRLPANSSICHNHHAYNFTSETQLREIWMNVWFIDESEITQRASPIFLIAGPWEGVPPGTQTTVERTKTVEESGRIISMFGHRHAWTERFAVWKNDELVYDSWDWEESVVFNYDSITENPPPDPDLKVDGATSGMLPVEPGDEIHFECDINNGSDQTLFFRNALYDGEMCILFGSTVGVSLTGF